MRNLGMVLLLGGVLGFFYCSSRLARFDPVPEGKSIAEYLEYPAGKWELGRYLCGAAAGIGSMLALFAKTR